ncbi:MAG: sigma-70 family RNA polymerase sigma factor [Acidobacteriota bacterium]
MRTATHEELLVDRLRRRDETAVADLASLFGARVYQMAYRYMKNHEDAEEVVQDVLLKVFTKIEHFRGDAALSSWIYRITFNTAMSRLRNTRTMRRVEVAEVEVAQTSATVDDAAPRALDVADWSNLADERVLRQEMRATLARAVDDLPAIYRAPVILRDLQGLSTEEASSRLKVKDQTLKSRLHRGRLMLRARLSAFADGLSLHRPMEAY